MEQASIVITQGTKNFYFLDPPDLPVVVERLRAAGYREAPHWYLTKRGAGLLITPKTRRTGFGFRLWAAPRRSMPMAICSSGCRLGAGVWQ